MLMPAHREPVGKRKLDPVDMEQLQPVDMMKLPLIGMEKPMVITKLTPTGKEKPKEKRVDMTKLTPIEKEKLKNYLFPANPYNDSVFEQVLLDQLVSVFNKAYRKLFQMRNATDTVNHALFIVDLDMAEDDPYELGDASYEFETSHFFYLVKFISLQRIDGRKVDYNQDIRGKKYVMACVLSVPDTWNSCAWEVAIKSHELYAQRKDDFELIIFLRKRLYGWEEFASFKDFLEPFHQSCIVAYLDDISPSLKHNQVLVFDLNNRVLFQGSLEDLSHVGSSAFPFEEAVMSLWQQLWHLKHSSLEALLGVEPSHKVFRKIPGTDPLLEEWRCISEFQSKIVFLYTYHSGRRLALLYDTVKGLREQGVEFEIITAYVPCVSYHNPLQFLEAFSSLVAKRGLSWWVVPYDSSTYPRLRPLYAEKSYDDQLIVFDPNLDDGDPHGLQVLDLYGPSMFPFTKKPVIEHVLKELNKVTLESLFEPITRLCKGDPDYDNDVYENKSVLEGKDVLVYFDSYDSDSPPVDEFVSWYNSFGEKEKRRNTFEVVCVYLYTLKQAKYDIDSRLQFPKWLISSVDEKAYANHVVENFFLRLFKHEFSTLVAFGKDGKICSLCAHRLLSSSSEAVTFPFNGDLREEIFDIFNDYFTKLISSD